MQGSRATRSLSRGSDGNFGPGDRHNPPKMVAKKGLKGRRNSQ